MFDKVLPPVGSITLGLEEVRGSILLPSPAAKTTACMTTPILHLSLNPLHAPTFYRFECDEKDYHKLTIFEELNPDSSTALVHKNLKISGYIKF